MTKTKINTLPGEAAQECFCISKAKYSRIRSALKIGLEAMKFGNFYKTVEEKKILANIEAFIKTV